MDWLLLLLPHYPSRVYSMSKVSLLSLSLLLRLPLSEVFYFPSILHTIAIVSLLTLKLKDITSLLKTL
jgi:hypothetical protein